ncbi:MAG: hypothetical protein CMIDDMOC_00515 [Sodalis sp. Fle]|nr:MAG: hypothetical protein CMIDDMOC_00515 [Sodalis sp. Fle]
MIVLNTISFSTTLVLVSGPHFTYNQSKQLNLQHNLTYLTQVFYVLLKKFVLFVL